MNRFDFAILQSCSEIVTAYPTFATFIGAIVHRDMFKGMVLLALFWGVWFGGGSAAEVVRTRIILIGTIGASIVSIGLARFLAFVLPFRVRPISLGDGSGMGWNQMSSFPSDHAALFFALSVGLLFTHRQVGRFALAYTIVVILAPRVLLGLHFPTDIIAGMAIGIVSVALFTRPLVANRLGAKVLSVAHQRPGLFYALMFALSYQVTTLFYDVRKIAGIFTGPG